MPRKARKYVYDPEGTYHVVCRGNNGQAVCQDEADFLTMKSIIHRIKSEMPFALYHYAIMNNHLHLLIKAFLENHLSLIMKAIQHLYANYHQKKYGRTGHLWQGRYKNFPITTDAYHLTCGVYIELNPVRAGLTDEADSYLWSSAKYYLDGAGDDLVDMDPAFIAGGDFIERSRWYAGLLDSWKTARLAKKTVRDFFKEQPVEFFPKL